MTPNKLTQVLGMMFCLRLDFELLLPGAYTILSPINIIISYFFISRPILDACLYKFKQGTSPFFGLSSNILLSLLVIVVGGWSFSIMNTHYNMTKGRVLL